MFVIRLMASEVYPKSSITSRSRRWYTKPKVLVEIDIHILCWVNMVSSKAATNIFTWQSCSQVLHDSFLVVLKYLVWFYVLLEENIGKEYLNDIG